jgi:hypothetical protein
MTDLAVLVADKDIEQALRGLLSRRCHSLGIHEPATKIFQHPDRDPGCYHRPGEVLQPHLGGCGLVVLDAAWKGRPAGPGSSLEEAVWQKLVTLGWEARRVAAVVIEPELEAWVWSDSPQVADVLGWNDMTALGGWLHNQGLWPQGEPKPPDPKESLRRALREADRPCTPRVFRELAERVSVNRCRDPSFQRLRDQLVAWFG